MNELQTNALDAFRTALNEGIKKIVEASKVYVEALDSGLLTHDDFVEANPGIPAAAWSGFEAVGRDWMDYRLLYHGSRACSSIKLLTKSQQTRVLDEGVEVLTCNGDVLKVDVNNLTGDQVKQVFDRGVIRDLSGQRAYMESVKTYRTSADAKPAFDRWSIKSGKLVVVDPTTFSKRDLKNILEQLS
jgi:hypothetical protein